MKINLQTFSFRFAEQVLNSKLSVKQEIEDILNDTGILINDSGGNGLNFSRIDIYEAIISLDILNEKNTCSSLL